MVMEYLEQEDIRNAVKIIRENQSNRPIQVKVKFKVPNMFAGLFWIIVLLVCSPMAAVEEKWKARKRNV